MLNNLLSNSKLSVEQRSDILRARAQEMLTPADIVFQLEKDPTRFLDICAQIIQNDFQMPRTSEDIYEMRIFVVSTYLNGKINEGGHRNTRTKELANLFQVDVQQLKQLDPTSNQLNAPNDLSNSLRGVLQKEMKKSDFVSNLKKDPTEFLDICEWIIQLDLLDPRSSQDIYQVRLLVVSAYLNDKITEGGDMNALTLKLAQLFLEDVKRLKQLDPTNNQLETYQRFALTVRLTVSRNSGGLTMLVLDDQNEDEMRAYAAVQRDVQSQNSKPTAQTQASGFRFTPAAPIPAATTQESKIANNPNAFQKSRDSLNTSLIKPKKESSSCCGCTVS